jgi:YndJ-like protein
MLATVAARRLATSRPAQTAVMVTVVLLGPPVVAVGFEFAPALQVAGAVLLTLGLTMLSWLTVRVVVSAAGDLLAVWWAIGMAAGLTAPSVPVMARSHGLANAIGFAFLGVLGWRRVAARERAGQRALTAGLPGSG